MAPDTIPSDTLRAACVTDWRRVAETLAWQIVLMGQRVEAVRVLRQCERSGHTAAMAAADMIERVRVCSHGSQPFGCPFCR